MLGDTIAAEKSISEIRSIVKRNKLPESIEELAIGIYVFMGKGYHNCCRTLQESL